MRYQFQGFGKKESMRDAVAGVISELMARDEKIVVCEADLGSSLKTMGLYPRYGQFDHSNPQGRVVSYGVSEQNMMAGAGGWSLEGYKPWVSTFVLFALRGAEPFYQAVAIPNANVKLWLSHYGIGLGKDGPTAQSLSDIGFWRNVPNVKGIFTPADAEEARQAAFSMYEHDGIFVLRLSRNSTPGIFGKDYVFTGEGVELFDMDGRRKVTLVSNGEMTHQVLAASLTEVKQGDYPALLERGIGVRVIHMPAFPVDRGMIKNAAQDSDWVVTVEDHFPCGLGSAVAEVMAEHPSRARLRRIGVETFAESGDPQDLYRKYRLDGKGLAERALALYGE